MAPVRIACEALQQEGVKFTVYDSVRVEPSDQSLTHAIDFARKHDFDGFLAVGGGSVMVRAINAT